MSSNYSGLKQAINDEKDMIRLLQQLPEKDLHQLMSASANYAAMRQAQIEKDKEAEKTKQMELDADVKKKREEEETKRHAETLKNQREQLKIRREELEKLEETRAEEAKKVEEHRVEREKELLEHRLRRERENQAALTQAKLKAKREFEKLDEERLEREQGRLKLEHQLKEEEREKEKLRAQEMVRYKLREKAKLQVEMADFDLEQRKKAHAAFFKDETERALALEEVRARAELSKERLRLQMREHFFSGEEGRERLRNIALVGVGLIGAGYTFKVLAPLVARALRNYFFRPTLVTKMEKAGALAALRKRLRNQTVPDVILPPALEQRMQQVIEGTRNTASRRGFFGHIMLYGKPGTGKSMFGEKLAREAGMDFAMMSGPSFDQFESAEAITEIKNLFKWARSSSRGVLLFIDECDSFLEDRSTLTSDRVRVLNEFIYQTGTESDKFMLCFETNRPDILDPAVQSRATQTIEFPAPSAADLRRLTAQYVQQYIRDEHARRGWSIWDLFSSKPRLDASVLTEERVNAMADTFAAHEFVGRDVTNAVIALSQAVYASSDFVITEEMVARVVGEQVLKKEREHHFAAMREKRQHRMFGRASGGAHSH